MKRIVTFNELSRLKPTELYSYYHRLSHTLHRTKQGTYERRMVLASLEHVIQAMNVQNNDDWNCMFG